MVELLLDVPEALLPRSFPYLQLIKDGSIASVVFSGNPLIVVLSRGFIRIVLLGLVSFSFSVSVPRSVVVLSFFLWPLHLSGEFLQVSQQTRLVRRSASTLSALACRVSRASLGCRLSRSPCWSCIPGGLA